MRQTERLSYLRPLVLRYLRRHVRDPEVCEDLTQEAMLRAFRNLRRLREPRALESWMLRIAYHVAMDWHRSGGRGDALGSDGLGEALESLEHAEPAGTEAGRLAGELGGWRRRLRRALGELSGRDRVLLIAHYFVGLSCREIASRSALSLANVKVRLHRARRRMRGFLPPERDFRAFLRDRERADDTRRPA